MRFITFLKLIFITFILNSCSFNDSEMTYEDKLVAFASISANLPVIDTIFVSKTAPINDGNIVADDLKINGAEVRLIEDSLVTFYNFTMSHQELISQFMMNQLLKKLSSTQNLLSNQDFLTS